VQGKVPIDKFKECRVSIKIDADIVTARQQGRMLAAQLGFASTDLTLIATAISELARNIVLYAKSGEIILQPVQNGQYNGIELTAIDEGPGISDVKRALQIGYSTSGSLGMGLPGVRRLMDEFEIKSNASQGTIITAKKWKR
jgi:serine/threonine-protein kinase RsbT